MSTPISDRYPIRLGSVNEKLLGSNGCSRAIELGTMALALRACTYNLDIKEIIDRMSALTGEHVGLYGEPPFATALMTAITDVSDLYTNNGNDENIPLAETTEQKAKRHALFKDRLNELKMRALELHGCKLYV
jgi:hypothetical protein